MCRGGGISALPKKQLLGHGHQPPSPSSGGLAERSSGGLLTCLEATAVSIMWSCCPLVVIWGTLPAQAGRAGSVGAALHFLALLSS